MITFIAGLVSVFVILFFSLEGNLSAYLQWHSFLLVIGGTVALFLFTTPQSILSHVGRAILSLFKPETHFSLLQEDLRHLVKNRGLQKPSQNELLQYASDLWQKGVDPELFIVLISERKTELDSKISGVTQAIKNLAKYPPALGMSGTVMGMMSLFSALDSHKESIGTSLSVAMTATFFGLFASNFLLSPLGDRLHVKQMQQARINENIYEVLLLINRGEPAVLIQEEISERAA